jgi:hypothetical protein
MKKHYSVKEATDPVSIPEQGVAEDITPETIHKLADSKDVKWDNDPAFLALTKRLTGKRHLDDLDQAGLQRVKQHLEKQDSSEVTEEMIAKRLSKELNLFKQGQKSDKELSTKPKDKAVHKKVKEVSDHRSGKIGGMEMEPIFVIHVDGKPKVKFKSKQQALTTYTELRKQFPDSNVEVIETQHPKNSFTETRK